MAESYVLMSGIMSETAAFTLTITTPNGRLPYLREIDGLIRLLQVARGFIAEDEASTPKLSLPAS